MERFRECLKFVLKWEGGYTNHPLDKGGATNYGITQRVYDVWRRKKGLPTQSVAKITPKEVEQIYWENYWLPAGCDKLPPPLDLVVFDSGVNCGVGRVRKWLEMVKGERTLRGKITKLIELRRKHYLTIVEKNPTQRVFLKGWLNRLRDLERAVGI